MSQVHIRLADYEATAPPEKVLGLSVVGGVLFLDIEHASETNKTDTYTRESSIGIHVDDFYNALNVAVQEDQNSRKRINSNRNERPYNG